MNLTFENPCPGQANGLPAYYFTQAVQMLLATHCTLGNPDDYPADFSKSVLSDQQFDFIIIGGGSSGSVIANRLSEIKTWKILLIESGGDPTFESDIPNFGLSLPGRELDWKFETNRTGENCLGMEDETCRVFQGKVLGGTSSINKMHYLRGVPQDYDEWEELGNSKWGYQNVLKYFKKSEKLDEGFKIVSDDGYDNSEKTAVGKYHSKSGLLSVNHFASNFYLSEVKNTIFAAGNEVQVPQIADPNRDTIGFFNVWGTIHEGNRGNSAKAFLTPVKNRQNLFVLKNTTVLRLIFKGRRITGVVVKKNEGTITLLATKEVLLSAGVINSPRLLMLSGIGPQQHLENIGIRVVKNLPGVGENLQCHLTFFGLPVALKTETKSISHLQKIDAMYHFISRGTGFFGSIGLNDVMAYISTNNQSVVPDLGILHYLNHARDYYTFNELLISVKIKNEIRDQFAKATAKSAVLLIAPTLLKPNSRGRVELTGPNFHNPPKIHPNFLTDKQDLETLLKGIQFGLKLIQTKAFEKLEPEILKLKVEGCHDWECLIRHLSTSMHDAAGTCKMGPSTDPLAVVDDRLRVYGVDGLRVADSSIMPNIIRGSVTVAGVMIGEVASDFIKEEWKRKRDEL